jgi:hypothetical protein
VLPEIDLTVENIVIDGITASQIDYTVTIGLTQLATSSPVTVEMQGVGVVGSYSTDGVVGTNPACNVFQATSLIIAPGSTFDLHVTCPSLPSPGETYLIVRIDSANVIAEFDELNNVESTTLP